MAVELILESASWPQAACMSLPLELRIITVAP
jgi:hypothetical protein